MSVERNLCSSISSSPSIDFSSLRHSSLVKRHSALCLFVRIDYYDSVSLIVSLKGS